jgi:hypothetical protein
VAIGPALTNAFSLPCLPVPRRLWASLIGTALGCTAARLDSLAGRSAEPCAFQQIVERFANQRLNRGAFLQRQHFQRACHCGIKMAAHPNRADP